MARVYLETSFFSACVTTRTDVDSRSWKGRSLSWLKTQTSRHELYISVEVIAELSSPGFSNRDDALAFTSGFTLLPINEEVLQLAQILIAQHLTPGPLKGDALHFAVAAYHAMEYILTWNVKHLANPNKRVQLARILTDLGKPVPAIVTPDVLWEDDSNG